MAPCHSQCFQSLRNKGHLDNCSPSINLQWITNNEWLQICQLQTNLGVKTNLGSFLGVINIWQSEENRQKHKGYSLRGAKLPYMKLNQSDRNPLYVFESHKTNSEKSEKGSSNVLSNATFDALSVYDSQLSIETNQWIVHKFMNCTQKQENRKFIQTLQN